MKTIQLELRTLHPAQQQVLREAKRFNVLKNGRRWGKSTLAIELASQSALDGHICAYYTPTYKDLHEMWIELKSVLYPVTKEKNEQVKQLTLITGGKIDMWSMDDPNSGRGRKYHRVIIDEAEKASKFKEAWEQTIRPTLTDFKGDAWVLSTPKSINSYFNTLYENQYKYNDWMGWSMPTITNPHIDPEEVEQARQQLDPITFRQEFEAQSTQTANRPFFYCFENRHISEDAKYKEGHTVYLSFDFNNNPNVCMIAQHDETGIYIIDEVFLHNTDIYEVCRTVKSKYPNSHFMVTGDRSGLNRTGLNRNLNYYKVIKEVLELRDVQFKIPPNPFFEKNIVLCNAILANHKNLKINPKCKELIYDLRFVEWDGQKIIKDDRNKREQQAEMCDAFRYYLNTFHYNFIKS